MPDVGVLNLQIHDNSSTAAEGLGRLAAKLEAVKAATGGVRLGSVATGIKRINDELKNVQPSAIYKLKQLADVLEKIGTISGNVGGIRISFGGSSQSVDQIASQMQAARDTAAQATAEFEQIGNRIQEDIEKASNFSGSLGKVNEIVQQTGWSAQTTAEQFSDLFNAWNAFRMSNSLNAGSNPLAIGDGSGGSGAEWAYWKDGAVEVEGTVSEAMETIRLEAGQTIPLLTGIVEENEKVGQSFKSYTFVEDATEKVEALRRIFANSSDAVKQIIANIMGIDKNILFQETAASNVQTFGIEAQTAAGNVKELSDILQRSYGKQMVEDLVSASGKADLLKMRIDALKDSLAQKINNNTVDGNQIAQATSQIQSLQQEYDEFIRKSIEAENETKSLASKFSELMFGTEGLNGSFKRMFPTVSGLLSRFKNLVKYRMLRAVIKQISEGFKEGIENYYYYSKAVGGEFAPAMDSAASALLQMKNSIGAAAAPLIQSLIPLLQSVVNVFVDLVNYANQFFALINGQSSWSRALPETESAFKDIKKSADGAGKAVKDLLADWDELNIIQSESGGSGGGAGKKTMEDYSNMFEEVSEFDGTIKKISKFIKDNIKEVLGIVEKIGEAILLWKVSSAFSGIVGTLAGLAAAGLTAAIVFEVSTLFNNQYLKTGEAGWLVADLLSGLLGSFFMKKILTKVLGGHLASLAIPITMAVSAVAGIKTLIGNNDVSALSKEGLIASAENSLKAAFAAGYLLKHFGGYTLAQAAGGGLGAGVTTFGLVIGLKAIADTLDTRKFTSEIIKADFLSAGLVGTGIAITELALGGGAVAALTLGGGAALLTLGALFAIEGLLILSKGEDPIKWGDYDATEEEIKAFIDEEVFSGEPKTKISLANATIEPLGENKKKLEDATSNVLGTLQSVRLGLSTSAETDLRADIKTFLSTFNETSKSYQDALKVSVDLVPVRSASDSGQSIVENSGSRWDELSGIMTGLASQLTAEFDTAYSKDVDEVTKKGAEESIQKISRMMAQIADAVASGQAQARIAHNINTQIGNLTHGAMDDMLSYYEEQRDQLIAELVNAGNEAAEGVLAQYYAYEKLAEYALAEAGGNVEDATYKHYLAQAEAANADYQERLANLKEDAETAADKTLRDTEGAQKIREALLGKILPENVKDLFPEGGIEDINVYKEIIGPILDGIIRGDKGSTDLKNPIMTILDNFLSVIVGEENFDTYKKAIEDGLISYASVFGDVDVGNILTEAFGIANQSDEVRAAWEEVINSLFPDKPIKLPDRPIEFDTTSFVENMIAGIENMGNNAALFASEMASSLAAAEEEANRERIREALSGFEPGLQRYGAEFDAVQGELVGLYGADLVESVMDELGLFNTTLPEMNITQPVVIDLETEQINSDIGSVFNNAMNGFASVFNGDSNGILASVISAAQQVLPALSGGSGGGGMPFAGFPSDITITETRDSEQEISNTAEGTKRGNADLQREQNQTNSYMAQAVRYLAIIAQKSGTGGIAQSVAGGVMASALAAFGDITGNHG